ncbi:MAG TPA: protein kinase [Anaerolineales bacterium]|nr:protein kinase [Anaerolineales bacterium]
MDQPTWIGRTLSGRYRIEALLGQGGMSAVYKAMDPNLKRVVAIKLIHPHLSTDPSFVLRFESEASAVASLRHPNIVQVYDFNNDSGVYYMVLEFIPGETLQDRMKRMSDTGRQLSIQDALKFTINICDAVGYAHQRGMVHRDIKPANIMLDTQGQAILMDFGIVKILGGDSHTSTGAVVGTARYMPPEVIRGEVADHRSDIYSLGVTLFEMLSGRPPFVADSAMTLMMMHLNDPVPDVRGFRTDVDPELVEILEKSLAKGREDRYLSATEMAAALRHALAYMGSQPAVARPKDATPAPPAATVLDVPTVQPATIVERPAPVPPTASQPAPQTVVEPAPDTGSRSQPPPSQPPPPGTSVSTPASAPSRPLASRRSMWMIGGAGLAALVCLGAVFALGNRFLGGVASPPTSEPTETLALATNTSPATQAAVALATETPAFTETPSATPTPEPTATPEGPYVVITDIQVQGSLYAVDYEVHNFPEEDNLHVHIFFDTVPPEQAGSPASGPWKLTWGVYGNPPFTQYGIANRPAGATQLCALVANPNHSVQLGTGNCVDLPE